LRHGVVRWGRNGRQVEFRCGLAGKVGFDGT
jgi:hypothetical protein